MADIATLGIAVDSSSVGNATNNLEGMSRAADGTEKAIGALARALATLNNDTSVAGGATSKASAAAVVLKDNYANAAGAVDQMKNSLSEMNTEAEGSTRSVESVSKKAEDFRSALMDIGKQILGGDSPFLIAIEQGTKLSTIFSGAGGLRGAIGIFGEALAGLINPTTLIATGLIAGGAALIQYFSNALDSSKQVNDALKEHDTLIRDIKDAYGDAASGLDDYAKKSAARLETTAAVNAVVMKDAAKMAGQDFLESVGMFGAQRSGGYIVDSEFQPFVNAILALRTGIRDGKPDLDAFYASIKQIVSTDPEKFGSLGAKIIELAQAFDDTQQKVDQANAVLDLLGDRAAAQVDGVSALSDALRTLASIAAPAISQADKISSVVNAGMNKLLVQAKGGTIDEEARRRLVLGGQQALQRIDSQFVQMDDGTRVAAPIPESRPNIELDWLPAAVGAANGVSRSIGGSVPIAASAKEVIDNLIKSSQERIDQLRLETQLSGQSGIAADTLRMKLTMLKQGQDGLTESGEKGLALMPQLTKAVNDQATAYEQVATAAAQAKLAADLQFQQDQMSRSTINQTVASTQKQYGLPVDMNSQSAQLIRYNEQLKYARDLAGDFASTLANGLRSGEGLWKSFGNAAVSVLTKISDTLLNDVLNSLFKVNSAATGSGGGGGLLGALFGGLFGGGVSPTSSLWAPNSTLGDVIGYVPGAHANGTDSAPGGLAWVGERGPELVNMPRGSQVVPNHRLKAVNKNIASGANSGVHVTVGVSVDENGNLKAYVKNVAQSEAQTSTRQGLNDFNQQLPDRVAQINRNPRRR